jgi:hypothetical protein
MAPSATLPNSIQCNSRPILVRFGSLRLCGSDRATGNNTSPSLAPLQWRAGRDDVLGAERKFVEIADTVRKIREQADVVEARAIFEAGKLAKERIDWHAARTRVESQGNWLAARASARFSFRCVSMRGNLGFGQIGGKISKFLRSAPRSQSQGYPREADGSLKMPRPITALDREQVLEVNLHATDPFDFSHLFIFTGTALFDVAGEDQRLVQERLDLDFSQFTTGRLFNPQRTEVAASASPSSIHGSAGFGGEFTTWAVDRAFADISPKGNLILHVDVAVQGEGARLLRFAYQVFVKTVIGVIITDSSQEPETITVRDTPVNFGIKLFPLTPHPGGPVHFNLMVDNFPGLRVGDFGLPDAIEIPASAGFGSIAGTVRPGLIFPRPRTVNVFLACTTTFGRYVHRTVLTQE